MSWPVAQTPKPLRFRTFRTVAALMLREMASTHGRSPGGYLWAILEPAIGIALLSVVFQMIVRSPPLGNNFPYFFATGILAYMFYASISNKIAASIRYSKPFLTYPAVTFVDAMVARFLFNALTEFMIMVIVIGGIVVAFNIRPIMDWPAVFMALAMLVALTVSVGVMNCYLFSAYPIWQQIWAVVNRPMFIISGILFIPENVPEVYRGYMMINPLAHITSEMRKGFFGTYDAVHVRPGYVFTISAVLIILGLLLLLRNHKDLLQK
jgi:capsular polysaccharide transport system permease protein